MVLTHIALHTMAQGEAHEVSLWEINRLDSIGGFTVATIGEPKVVDTDVGKAVEFDGIDDGLLVNGNPMAGANEFTIEVVFKPSPGGLIEQRFVHFQQDDDNRILIELRSTPEDNWFLDTFIKSGTSSRALFAENFPHPTNEWQHAGLVYKDGVMKHYVNGIEELSNTVAYLEVNSGSTSLGVRQNLVSWYKGLIHTLKISHKALSPDEFMFIGDSVSSDSTSGKPVLDVINVSNNRISSSIFPNPAVEVATIGYEVQQTEHVIIKLYNLSMNQETVLLDEIQSPGVYRRTFECNSLPSGLYCYTIQIGAIIKSEKFVVLA